MSSIARLGTAGFCAVLFAGCGGGSSPDGLAETGEADRALVVQGTDPVEPKLTREFFFHAGMVVQDGDEVRVRMWARPGDSLELIRPVDEPISIAYEEDAEILVTVDGGPGECELPKLRTGEQTFESPSIEFLLQGACDASWVSRAGGEGLLITMVGNVWVDNEQGLPPGATELIVESTSFWPVGEVAVDDHPPHGPPRMP